MSYTLFHGLASAVCSTGRDANVLLLLHLVLPGTRDIVSEPRLPSSQPHQPARFRSPDQELGPFTHQARICNIIVARPLLTLTAIFTVARILATIF